MKDGDDWQELARTWQAQPVDLPALRRSTHWRTWRMRLVVGSELAATGFLLAFSWWAWDRPGTTDLHRYWLLFWCAVLPVYQWLLLSARRGLWRVADDSVVGLLRLRLKRARAATHLGWITISCCGLMMVALVAWFLLFNQLQPTADAAIATQRMWTIGLSLLFLLAVAAGTYYYVWRMRREQARLQDVLDEVGEKCGAISPPGSIGTSKDIP